VKLKIAPTSENYVTADDNDNTESSQTKHKNVEDHFQKAPLQNIFLYFETVSLNTVFWSWSNTELICLG
jgi:hypothetical protein